jgi:rhamnopyranosyl-N-acetylglucosaminyl-diphospho-decaprenol beta-1,3/1,4-galactofuranosyltransferase
VFGAEGATASEFPLIICQFTANIRTALRRNHEYCKLNWASAPMLASSHRRSSGRMRGFNLMHTEQDKQSDAVTVARGASSVAAIVLAFSRFETLQQLVTALKEQTRPPDEIIVIYQGSREDIAAWLQAQSGLTYIRQHNKGSAGGFCTGIEEAIRRGHGWSWIFDDDAIPKPTALQELVQIPYFSRGEPMFLASRVEDRHGKTYMSPQAADANRWYATVLQEKCVEVVGACWLGLLVNSAAVRKYGLPIAEFFLWEEDLEFTTRLARHGPGYCAINSVIVHYQDPSFDPFGKDFVKYAHYARNRVARAKLEPGSALGKMLRTARRVGHFTTLIAKRKAPLRAMPWVIRGVFFRPRVRYPAE